MLAALTPSTQLVFHCCFRGLTLPCHSQRNEIVLVKGMGSKATRHAFAFDQVFSDYTTQEEVFQAVSCAVLYFRLATSALTFLTPQTLAPIVDDVLKGYDNAVFAYGQTGTGKTYTMEGNVDVEEQAGIIPRACQAIFAAVNSPKYIESTVKVSYLEIYNEDLTDLLVDTDANSKVPLERTNSRALTFALTHPLCTHPLTEQHESIN